MRVMVYRYHDDPAAMQVQAALYLVTSARRMQTQADHRLLIGSCSVRLGEVFVAISYNCKYSEVVYGRNNGAHSS